MKSNKIYPFIPVEHQDEKFLPVTDSMVPGVKDIYCVSNYGRVYNHTTGKFIGSYDQDGYIRSGLRTKDNRTTSKGNHTLLMLAFRPIENYDPAVNVPNHLDGIPDHNTLDNLEWTDVKGNSRHAIRTGLHKMHGQDNPNNKLSEDDVRQICKLIETGKYYDTEIAQMFDVSYTNISDIHKGKIWTHVSKDYDLSVKKYRGLTPDKVRKMCEELQSGRYHDNEVAAHFGISTGTIKGIRNGSCWREISKDYDVSLKKKKKFGEKEIREMCEMIQSGQYYDTDIAQKYDTNPSFIGSLRKGMIWKNITKDYDMTVRKPR